MSSYGIPGPQGIEQQSIHSALVFKTGTLYHAISATANRVDITTPNSDAATVIQAALDAIQPGDNSSTGRLHIKGYGANNPYNITTAITPPLVGNYIISGDGPNGTTLQVPTGSDNNIFAISGTPSAERQFCVLEHIKLRGNVTDGTNNRGFSFNSTSKGVKDWMISNVYFMEFADSAVFLGGTGNNCWNNRFDHCIFEYSGPKTAARGAFEAAAGSDVRITNSKFLFNNGTAAIRMDADLAQIIGCWFYQNDRNDIQIGSGSTNGVLIGNKFQETGTDTANTYDAIYCNGDDWTIQGNVFGTAGNVRYWINLDTSSQRNIVTGNSMPNNGGTDRLTNAGSNIVRMNSGYITENSGTGTINNGATSATITHGLGYTPAAADICITLTENPTNTPGAIWVDTIGATTFQVNCENDPGASNLDFSWSTRKV
jgi:hypothetical protein